MEDTATMQEKTQQKAIKHGILANHFHINSRM